MSYKVEVIFKLGTLEVFSVSDAPTLFRPSGDTTTYFWRDDANPQSFGPFPSVFSAVKHYENRAKYIKDTNSDPNQGKIIEVDFKHKRRKTALTLV